jgi:hypothetical protein
VLAKKRHFTKGFSVAKFFYEKTIEAQS